MLADKAVVVGLGSEEISVVEAVTGNSAIETTVVEVEVVEVVDVVVVEVVEEGEAAFSKRPALPLWTPPQFSSSAPFSQSLEPSQTQAPGMHSRPPMGLLQWKSVSNLQLGGETQVRLVVGSRAIS